MHCANCNTNIGEDIDFSKGHVICFCGYTQTDADGGGYHNDPSDGFWRWGDMAKVLIGKLGIKQCGGCSKRQKKLNSAGEKIKSMLTINTKD